MTSWIDFAIYALLLIVLWFVNPRVMSRLAIPMLADRNAEWLAAHPEVVEITRNRRWHIRLHDALGTVSLTVLLTLQLGFWFPGQEQGQPTVEPWIALWGITTLLVIAYLVVIGSTGLYYHRIVNRYIPIGERRQASLERRSIGDFVPVWAQLVTYALVMINLTAWVVTAISGQHDAPLFWTRLVLLFALSVFFHFAAVAAVARRPNAMDRVFGPPYRRKEVHLAFSMQLLPPIIGAVRLYEELADTIVFDINRAMQLGLVLMIIAAFLSFARLAAGTLLWRTE